MTIKKNIQTPPPQSLAQKTWAMLREFLIVVGGVLLLNSFVMASFEVPTGSMEDTVMTGDFLFVNKFIYGGTTPYTIPFTSIRLPHFRVPGFRKIERGDVIVFDWPGDRDLKTKPEIQTWYLKRCIGLPGDTLKIINKIVYVNGEVFPNPPHLKFLRSEISPAGYAEPRMFPRGASCNTDNYGPVVIPKKGMIIHLDYYNFDQWEVFIAREGHNAELRAGKIYIDGSEADSYIVQRDYVFGMGDNRDDSLDSRFWGFIPVEDVIGTPMIVYWSWDPNIEVYKLSDKLRTIDFSRVGQIIH